MSDAAKDKANHQAELHLQHGAVMIEFIPKNDKNKNDSEVRSEVQDILLQMYVRSRTKTRSKKREGEVADAA